MADQSQYFWRVTSLHNKRRGRGGEGRYFSIENARSRTAQWVLQPSEKHKDTRKERPLPPLPLLLLIPGAPRRSSLGIWTPWSVRNELIGPWVMRETGAILIFCIILDERERERERDLAAIRCNRDGSSLRFPCFPRLLSSDMRRPPGLRGILREERRFFDTRPV